MNNGFVNRRRFAAKGQKCRRLYRSLCLALSLLVVFATVYSLMLPAVTLTDNSGATQDEAAPVAVNALSAENSEEWSLVTDANGVNQMALIMYYCTYNSEDTTKGIGGYEKHQLSPGNVSGYEQVPGISGINGNNYRFLIENAYTNADQSEYLIPLSYLQTAYGNKKYKYGTCDFVYNPEERCPFIYGSGDVWESEGGSNRFRSDIMRAASYTELNGEVYVKITAASVSGQPYKIGVVYYVAMEKATDTEDPGSATINLFDYWSTPERFDSDNHPSSQSPEELNSGINANHALKFGKGISRETYGAMNYSWGGSYTPSKVTQGIVANTLGEDRYPQLADNRSTTMITGTGDNAKEVSFMPQDITAEQSTESLAYLFDPYMEVEGKKSFSNVSGLLTRDSEGYYRFNSKERAAELNESTGDIVEYMSPAGVYESMGHISGQFFPFNDAHRTTLIDAEKDPINHYFGLTLSARFIQQYNGHKGFNSSEDVIFHFAGDNDVWIFIDNVLVADLGGLGSASSVTINFRTGVVDITDTYTVTIDGVETVFETGTQDTTIKDAFLNVDPNYENAVEWNGNTFANNTMHTLKFYYLERGNYDSNLELQYNLTEIPPSGISKVDQYGNKIDGARMAIYKSDVVTDENGEEDYQYIKDDKTGNYTSEEVSKFYIDSSDGKIYANKGDAAPVITPVYCDVTVRGELIFSDNEGMPLTIDEIRDLFGDYFILREVYVPPGYRVVCDEVLLRIEGGVILCSNIFKSGVWADSHAMVTANNALFVAREYRSVASALDAASVEGTGDDVELMGWMYMGESNSEAGLVKGTTVCKGAEQPWLSKYPTTNEGDWIQLYQINYYSVENNMRNGTLFAVTLKRNTRNFWNGYGYDYWFPVYGTAAEGYTLVQEGVPDEPADWSTVSFDTAPTNVKAAIEAAKQQVALQSSNGVYNDDGVVFKETGGGMQVTIENLPGKIQRYYSFMNTNGLLVDENGNITQELKDSLDADLDPQYVVAYYWTSGELKDANEENTVRVYSHNNLIEGVQSQLDIQWGTTISVPNLENRLFFNKLNDEEEKVNDAIFALYDVYEAAPSSSSSYDYNYIYYKGKSAVTGDDVYIAPLDNSNEHPDRAGQAAVFGINKGADLEDTADDSVYVIGYGDYQINKNATVLTTDDGNGNKVYAGLSGENIGRITVTLNNEEEIYSDSSGNPRASPGDSFYADPAKNAEGNSLVGATHNACQYVSEEGTGHFDHLLEGRYYLREIKAPAGYDVNNEEIQVLVDKNGVYANAGDADNDVSVGNGIGYLSNSLVAFASHGMVDETLTWVYGTLLRNDAKDFSAFEKVSGDVIRIGDGTSTDPWLFVKQYEGNPKGYGYDTTPDRSMAMVTYLEYAEGLADASDRDVIFDYTPTVHLNENGVDVGQAARPLVSSGEDTLEGEGVIRLYTDQGWSDLAIYQDYAHGENQLTTGITTNYSDLTALGNISNLFSSSTFVQVKDARKKLDVLIIDEDTKKYFLEEENGGFDLWNEKTKIQNKYIADGTFVMWYEDTNEQGETLKAYYTPGMSSEDSATWMTEQELRELYNSPEASGEVLAANSTDGIGNFPIYRLKNGTYYLKEIRAPAGYITLGGVITVSKVNENVTVSMEGSDPGIFVEGTPEDGQTIVIPYGYGYELPQTGGCGTIWFTLGGLLIMTASFTVYLYRRKHRCERRNI